MPNLVCLIKNSRWHSGSDGWFPVLDAPTTFAGYAVCTVAKRGNCNATFVEPAVLRVDIPMDVMLLVAENLYIWRDIDKRAYQASQYITSLQQKEKVFVPISYNAELSRIIALYHSRARKINLPLQIKTSAQARKSAGLPESAEKFLSPAFA